MKVVSVVWSVTLSNSSKVPGGGGVIFRPGMGMNYFLVSHCMQCGDLNSVHKDFYKLT